MRYPAFTMLLLLVCTNVSISASDETTPSLDEVLIETSLKPIQNVSYKSVLHVNKSPAHWQLDVGAAILTRNTLSSSPILIELAPQPGDLLNANSFRFNTAAGPDISGIKYRDQDLFFMPWAFVTLMSSPWLLKYSHQQPVSHGLFPHLLDQYPTPKMLILVTPQGFIVLRRTSITQ